MGAGVTYYLPGTNEIPPLLLLPYLHDQVEQVPRLLQPPGIRFLVQRSVMSSFLATRQKTEPAVIASVARRRACGRTGWLRGCPSRVPLRFSFACGPRPQLCSTFTPYADDSKTSGYSKSWTVPGAEFDWGGTSPKQ